MSSKKYNELYSRLYALEFACGQLKEIQILRGSCYTKNTTTEADQFIIHNLFI